MPGKFAYKIITTASLALLEETGRFEVSPAEKSSGYIRVLRGSELEADIGAQFPGRAALAVIVVDTEALEPGLRWETRTGSAVSGHLYDALTLEAGIAYRPLERADDGTIKLPVVG